MSDLLGGRGLLRVEHGLGGCLALGLNGFGVLHNDLDLLGLDLRLPGRLNLLFLPFLLGLRASCLGSFLLCDLLVKGACLNPGLVFEVLHDGTVEFGRFERDIVGNSKPIWIELGHIRQQSI